MANTITALPGQSTADLIIQSMGTLQGAYDFCNLNGCALSDIPAVGTVYTIPALTASNSDQGKLAWMAVNGVTMATGAAVPAAPVGISMPPGVWQVLSGVSFESIMVEDIIVSDGYSPADLLWYTEPTGGSPVAMPTMFPEPGVSVHNYWVSQIIGGEESPRVIFSITVLSLPIVIYDGLLSGVGHVDLVPGSIVTNFAQSEGGVAGWENVSGGAPVNWSYGHAYATASGWYRVRANNNANGSTTYSAPFYITIT